MTRIVKKLADGTVNLDLEDNFSLEDFIAQDRSLIEQANQRIIDNNQRLVDLKVAQGSYDQIVADVNAQIAQDQKDIAMYQQEIADVS